MALFKFKSISILILVLLSTACGAPEPGSGDTAATGGYQAHLVFPEATPRPGRTTQALSGIDCDERDITTIEFNFILNGEQYGPHFFDCKNHHATISGVPAGRGVLVEVFADDSYGEAVYEGSEVVDIVRDQVTPGGTVKMEYATFTNDFGMKFVRIPAADRPFTMGSPPDELGRDEFSDDENAHTVTLSEDYYMQVTEVTQAQWRSVWYAADAIGITIPPDREPSHFYACGDNCPVESVTWEDVDQFIKALNRLDSGKNYALPKEAWWEYAARGGNSDALPTGNLTVEGCSLDNNLNRIGWYCGNSDADYSGCYELNGRDMGPQPVGGREPNAYGLYDMHGNVYEWCLDWYKEDYYQESPPEDPECTDPTSGYRVLRGGGWSYDAGYCRSANRYGLTPGDRGTNYGFRLAAPLVSR